MTVPRLLTTLTMAVLALSLAACGGGDDDPTAAPTSSATGGLAVSIEVASGSRAAGEPIDVTVRLEMSRGLP